jgi:hypothetical protein
MSFRLRRRIDTQHSSREVSLLRLRILLRRKMTCRLYKECDAFSERETLYNRIKPRLIGGRIIGYIVSDRPVQDAFAAGEHDFTDAEGSSAYYKTIGALIVSGQYRYVLRSLYLVAYLAS